MPEPTEQIGTIVCGQPAPGASHDVGDFADLTAVPVVDIRWAPPLICVVFAGELDDDTAARVRLRIVSASRADEEHRASVLAVARLLVEDPPDDPVPALTALVRDLAELVLRPVAEPPA